MASPILVTGGTGTLGRQIVPRLREAGHAVRVLSRSARAGSDGVDYVTGDLDTGKGIDAAVGGVEVVVHCAGSSKGDGTKARHLVDAAARAGVRHVVHISVVGADRVPLESGLDRALFGYFGSKLDAERVVAGSGLPWTTLRATQFHDLMARVAGAMANLPVLPVPAGFRFQPVDTGEVAATLVELALSPPAGLVPDLAGPRVYTMADLLRGYLRAHGKHRAIMPVRLPGVAARALRAGANLSPDRAVGQRTWEDFLDALAGHRGGARQSHVGGQPELLQGADDPPRQVDLPPEQAVAGRAGEGVVVVVPGLAEGEQGQRPVVG